MSKYFNKQAKDSSLLRDFVSGVEPTGVFTLQNASRNKKHHLRHKLVGNVGGFTGGFVTSVGLSALGTAGLGKILTKTRKSSLVGPTLITGAKEMLGIFNPKGTVRTIRRLSESSKISHGLQSLPKSVETLKGGTTSARQKLSKKLQDLANKHQLYKNKYKSDPTDDFRKGMSITGAAAAGVLGGSLNTLSANTQYDVGRKMIKRVPKVPTKQK